MSETRRAFFGNDFPGVVWSNPEASDTVMIRATLAKPHFYQILAICRGFGLKRVKAELEEIKQGTEPLSYATLETLASLLGNIEIGITVLRLATERVWNGLRERAEFLPGFVLIDLVLFS